MRSPRRGAAATLFQTSLIGALIGFGLYFDHAASSGLPAPEAQGVFETALVRESASPEVLHIAQWAVASHDHAGLPFVVVDKAQARLFAFDPEGRLRGSTPVLLGAAKSDEADAPATPAGRFVADNWLSARGDGIVWVNGDTQLALHALPSPKSPGRGMQRLASARVDDKRISEGSLHVAAEFYRDHLGGLRSQPSVVYVLPETLPVEQVFGSYAMNGWPLIAQSPRARAARSPS
jgi:hypothetical protein